MEVKYDNNKIYFLSIHFYSRDESYGTHFRIWGIYAGMNSNGAEQILAEHGYGCF